MPLDRIDTKTLRQRIYDQIRDAIMAGEMVPGQTFSLREFAHRFGVSTMPVREALWQFQTEQVIRIESNKRMSINTVSRTELQDLFELRLFVEVKLAQRACDLRTENNIRDMNTILANIRSSMTDIQQYLYWNREFHFSLYEIAGGEILLNTIRRLWLRVAPYFAVRKDKAPEHVRLVPHELMLQSLINGDADAMAKALESDLYSARMTIDKFVS